MGPFSVMQQTHRRRYAPFILVVALAIVSWAVIAVAWSMLSHWLS